MKKCIWFGVLVSILFLSGSEAADPPRIISFSPQGSAKNIRQVKVRFSHPMVAFGDPRSGPGPFDVNCPVSGQGRWVDSRNWVYDFQRDLPGGLACEFTLRKGLRALSGERIEGRRKFSFSTGGPAVTEIYPGDGAGDVDEEQVFVLTLDAEAEERSLYKHVAFIVEGIENPIGIRVIEGEEREIILRQKYQGAVPARQPVLLLGCRQRFPSGTRIKLVWGKGVLSRTMIPTERDQVFSFRTRPPFTANFQCTSEKAAAACSPLLPMTLRFTSPISRENARLVSLNSSDGRRWPAEPIDDPQAYVVTFRGPFPEHTDFLLEVPSELEDDAQRRLSNAERFPLRIRTGSHPPLAKFASRFSIVELKGDRSLPVTVRNLEAEIRGSAVRIADSSLARITGKVERIGSSAPSGLQAALRRVASATRERSMFSGQQPVKGFKLPKATRDLEVIGIPLEESGLYLIELESLVLGGSLLGSSKPAYVPAAALVTDMSVHFKWGRESSLVWVTSLDKGEAVMGAAVTVQDCTDRVLWQGETGSDGIARISVALPSYDKLPSCGDHVDYRDYPQMGALSGLGGGLFVVARTSNDMSFVHSSWDRGIEPFRFNLPQDESSCGIIGHTVLDRALFRAGETVHMKHIMRRHTGGGFEFLPQGLLPDTVAITHVGSGQIFRLPVAWDQKGCALSLWEIPKEAKLGTYEISLVIKPGTGSPATATSSQELGRGLQTGEAGDMPIRSGAFRVEEFRVPMIKTMIKTPTGPLILPKEVTLHIGADYLAGGTAKGLAYKLRSSLRPVHLNPFEGFEGFVFSNGSVKVGQEGLPEEGDGEVREAGPLRVAEGSLDEAGAATIRLDGLPDSDSPKDMLVELEYRDPNGEVQTTSSQIRLWNAGMLLGLSPASWASSGERIMMKVASLDLSGRPLEGVSVSLSLFERRYLSHRKRLVGGFYAYEHREEIRELGVSGKGITDQTGIFSWETVSPISGNVIVMAEARDKDGNRVFAHADIWVAQKGRWWFEAGDHDRIDLIPEKRRYEPGQKAVFQVRMPFSDALALVSVEREGVIECNVRRLSGERPVIEVPIKGSFAPNVFVSVLAVRGRIQGVQPTAMADMGRPSYRLGIAEIFVGWSEHELKVGVVPEKNTFKVREKTRVKIKAYSPAGSSLPEGVEAALIAVDEGLLELAPNSSWDVLSAMMGRRAYEVLTSTAQMEVVGRRHYGLKALPAGGGGGRRPTRELFDTLVSWKGSIPLDENGEGEAEIDLNDSVSGFRIQAVVLGGAGLFGSGHCSIRTTQDLIIISGLPPLVRDGDTFRAEFTIRNASERAIKAAVYARSDLFRDTLGPTVEELLPGGAKVVGWDVTVPKGRSFITWELEAEDTLSGFKDRVKASQRVVPALPARTFQATLERVDKDMVLRVQRPPEAEKEAGGLAIDLRESMVAGLEPAREFMEMYPYGCLEQRVSRAIALRDRKQWRTLMAQMPSYLDPEGLAKYFPSMPRGSAELTSYIVSIAAEASWNIPAEVLKKMEQGLKAFVEGRLNRDSPVSFADLPIRKLAAMEALSRIGYFDKRYLGLISVEPELWPTSALLDWMNILIREKKLPGRDTLLKEAEGVLRSRLDLQGTALSLSAGRRDSLWWLMVSDDVNSLRALLTAMHLEGWQEDLPRMARGAMARQRRGRWDLTVANAWGVLAIERFSSAFEKEPVSGTTKVTMGGRTLLKDWQSPNGALVFPWGEGTRELALSHAGKGAPWAVVKSIAAIPLTKAFSSGYRVNKSLIPLEKKKDGVWSRGDTIRVRLDMEAQADQTWVVVSDPIPAGASILGTGLVRDSVLLTGGEQTRGLAWPSYEERSFEAYRAYYEYVPKGRWSLEYTIRINHAGLFHMPPTRVEALYLPEMMAELPNPPIEVRD